MALVRILRSEHQAAQQLSRHREPSLMRDRPEQVGADTAAAELAELRQQVAQLRQAVRARDDFIAIAAHELRNPMTPILGVAELALAAAQSCDGQCPPRITILLERLQLLARDFIKRSTRLLDISRVETGNLQLERSPTDISLIVLQVVQNYETSAARGGGSLTVNVQDGVTGLLDPLAVEQVV